jgi:hypothetical protein
VLVVSATTAAAFYGATGTGNITGVTASSAGTSTVDLSQQLSPVTISPGDNFTVGVSGRCLTGCPAFVTTIRLGSWSSDKAGCTEAAMPGSFSMPTLTANQSVTTTAAGLGVTGTITWANLAIDQSACKGAAFTFQLVTP